jgi:hypothetical protein
VIAMMSGMHPDADDPAAEERLRAPAGLLDRLRADPARAPETIALAASEQHAPSARAWAATQTARYGHDPAEMARRAKRQHATLARVGGAVTGLGGFVGIVPDMVGLAWIKSRLVFYVAAAYGFDPGDPMRPAELLVLHDIYPDPLAARRALDGLDRPLAVHYADRRLGSSDSQLVRRLAQMAGKEATQRLAGRVVPGVASILNAATNERATRALGDRAIRFYGG